MSSMAPQSSTQAQAQASWFTQQLTSHGVAQLRDRRQAAETAQPGADTYGAYEPTRLSRSGSLLTGADWHDKETTLRQKLGALEPGQAAWALAATTARNLDGRAYFAAKLHNSSNRRIATHTVPQENGRDAPAWRTWLNPLSIFSTDGITLLDAMLLRNPNGRVDAPLLLILGGAGSFYENGIDAAYDIAKKHDVSVLLYNSRGVGNSLGHPCSTQDFNEDGLTMLREATRRSSNVALLGRSMGGGVATEMLARLHAEDPDSAAKVKLLLLENTFTHYSAVAANVTGLSPTLMGLIFGTLGFRDLSPLAALPHIPPSTRKVVTYVKHDLTLGPLCGLEKALTPSLGVTVGINQPIGNAPVHSTYRRAPEAQQALIDWSRAS